MRVLYTAESTATGGRDGRVRSADGFLDLELVTPPELGGPGGRGTNPEQLLASGYAACFLNAVKLVAARLGGDMSGATVTARVGIGPREDGSRGFGLDFELDIRLPAMPRELAEKAVELAHRTCPFSFAFEQSSEIELSLVETR